MPSTILTKCSPINLRNFAHYVEITQSNKPNKTEFLKQFVSSMYKTAEVVEAENGFLVYPKNNKQYSFIQYGNKYIVRIDYSNQTKKVWQIN